MLPLLIPLITSVVPGLIGHLFGPNAGEVAKQVTDVTQAVFGTTDADQITKAIAADPNKALEYKSKLLDVQSAESERQHQERMAELSDVQGARSTFGANNKVFWLGISQLALSYGIVCSVGYGLFELLTDGIKIRDPGTVGLVFTMIGGLCQFAISEAIQTTRFFFGSSEGSQQKADALGSTMNQLARSLANSKPAK